MHGRFAVGRVRRNQEANLMKNNLAFNIVHGCRPVGIWSCFSSHSTPPSFCSKFAITLVALSFLPMLKYHFQAFLHPLCSPFVFRHSFCSPGPSDLKWFMFCCWGNSTIHTTVPQCHCMTHRTRLIRFTSSTPVKPPLVLLWLGGKKHLLYGQFALCST